jgi:putative transposase
VQYINTRYRRSGILWDSRYKSSLIQAQDYLLLCQRYIELNPVRAALVDAPAHYRWTSYRCNALGQSNPLLAPHDLYLRLARGAAARQQAYRALFRPAPDRAAIADIRLALNQNQPLGNGRFLDEIERMTGQRRAARPRGRPRTEATEGGPPPGQGELAL